MSTSEILADSTYFSTERDAAGWLLCFCLTNLFVCLKATQLHHNII